MAEQYDRIAEQYVKTKEEFFKLDKDLASEFIFKNLAHFEGKVLIDIGCGAGSVTALLERMPFAAVYGVDPSEQMVNKAKLVVVHPDHVSVGSFEHTGMADESVDIVVSRFALHYVLDTTTAYEEVARILKPGGKFIQVVDHPVASASTGTFFEKEGKKYVRVILYGSVAIEFPYKNFTDYFSPTLLRLFEVKEISEWQGSDGDYQKGPNAMGFVAVKK